MPAVCHLLNLPYVQEMKSYRVPLNKALAREGSCPSQTRKVALQASEYAKQELAALDRRASVFFVFSKCIPATLGEAGGKRKLTVSISLDSSDFAKSREAKR